MMIKVSLFDEIGDIMIINTFK